MADAAKKPGLMLALGIGKPASKPKGGPGGEDPAEPDGDDAGDDGDLTGAAGDVRAALDSGDDDALGKALKAFVMQCDSGY